MNSRSIQLICNVEPQLSDVVWNMVRNQEKSMSTYLRRLVIEDLKTRGLLTDELVKELL